MTKPDDRLSWWVGLPRPAFMAEAKKRQPQMVPAKDQTVYSARTEDHVVRPLRREGDTT